MGMIEIRPEPAAGPVARALLGEAMRELVERYGDLGEDAFGTAEADELSPPHGTFLVLSSDGEPQACGGVKNRGRPVAEIKRMYVRPSARRQGHARRLLTALEDAAAGLGYRRIRLDVGDSQPEAIALYEAAGYRHVPAFSHHPRTGAWFEKELPAADPVAARPLI